MFKNPVGPNFHLIYAKWVYRNPMKVWEQFCYWLNELRSMWERARYGYSDRDLYSLDRYLLTWLPEAIRKLKDGHGYPAVLEDVPEVHRLVLSDPSDYDTQSIQKWHLILETIASGLEDGSAWLEGEGIEMFYRETPEEVRDAHHKKWLGEPGENGNTRLLNDEEIGLHFNSEAWNALQSERKESYDEALSLFVKWFNALWD